MLTAKTMLRRFARCDGDPEKVAAEVEAMKGESVSAQRARRERVKAKPRAPGKTKGERKETKRDSDRAVYAAVRERDDGFCCAQLSADVIGECGGALQIDHQWGRGKAPTTVENCRCLCREHHRRKTDGEPSRLMWLNDFREWATSRRYYAEVAKAERQIALERAQRGTPSVPVKVVRGVA